MPPPSRQQEQQPETPPPSGRGFVVSEPIPPGTPFGPHNFAKVAAFTCATPGKDEERWEKDVTDWIKSLPGTGGALDAVENGAAEVWLYEDEQGRLVGFGSLGTEDIESEVEGIPDTVCVIPFFGLHTDFRGKPDGKPPEGRYAARIFQGLINEAERRTEYPLIILYVDPDNPARTKIYPRFGFRELDTVQDEGRTWVRMWRRLGKSTESTVATNPSPV